VVHAFVSVPLQSGRLRGLWEGVQDVVAVQWGSGVPDILIV